MIRSVTALLLAVTIVASTRADDWPQFRGPGGLGVSTAKDLPETWTDDDLAWRLELPGAGASSPIALGDNLYLTCYSGYGTGSDGDMDDLRLHVVCVRQDNGKVVWDREIEPTLPESRRVRDHGYAGPTPTTDGKHLFVYFGKSGLFKLDMAGNVLWQASAGDRLDGWGCGTSPVLFEDLVIVNASVESSSLIGFSKETGKEVWRAEGIRRAWNTPHLVRLGSGDHELAVSVQGNILGFDPKSGKKLWTCAGIQDYVCPSIISQDGIVYAIGGRRSVAIAVRAGGRGDVTDSHILWEAKAGANVSSPVIHDGHMYWVSDRNQVAYCLRLKDGEVIYQERFDGQPYASALAADNKIYIVTRFDGTFVLAATPEFKQLSHNTFSDDKSVFNASPIVANGRLVLRSDKYLYCLK